jgi:hypothetical protein
MVHLLAPVGIDVAPTRRSLHLVFSSLCLTVIYGFTD